VQEGSTPGVFEAILRFRRMFVLIVLAVAALSAVVGLVLGRGTTASAQMVLRTPGTDDVVGVVASTESTFVRYVAQRTIFATSEPVLTDAANHLGGTTVDALRQEVTATADPAGDSITVTARASSAPRAAEIANRMVDAYRAQSQLQVSQASGAALAALRKQRDSVVKQASGGTTLENTSASQTVSDLDQRASQIGVAASVFGSGVSFTNAATPDAAKSAGLPLRDTAAGVVLGALIAGTVAWLRADRDRRLVEPEAAADLVRAPLLGQIERAAPRAMTQVIRPERMPFGEYRLVASALATMGSGVVVIAGSDAGEGRTTTAAQVAVAAARQGLRVLLVDACPPGGGVTTLFSAAVAAAGERDGAALAAAERGGRGGRGAASLLNGRGRGPALGLTGVADDPTTLDRAVLAADIGGGARLDLLPAAEQQRAFPGSASLDTLVGVLRGRYDMVVVDTPPFGAGGSDVAPVVGRADRVVLVVRRGARVAVVRRLVEQVELLGATVAGTVVTFLPTVDLPESDADTAPARELAER